MFDVTNERDIGDIKEITRIGGEKLSDSGFEVNEERKSQIDEKIPNHDMLFAGFPCQPFSIMEENLE